MLSIGSQTIIILTILLIIKLLGYKNKTLKTFNSFLKIKFDLKQILIAVTITMIIDASLILIQYLVLNGRIMPATFEWDTLIQPIAEEFLSRGVYTYVFLFTILRINKPKLEPKSISFKSKIIYSPINAFLFMLLHYPVQPINYFRFIDGLIYCGLYLYYDYNLVPSIIAHTLSNLLIIWLF